MKLTYDHVADALYVEFIDALVVSTRRVTPNVLVDLDENDSAVGIEVLFVRASGIDPLDLALVHYTPDHHAEKPDMEQIESGARE